MLKYVRNGTLFDFIPKLQNVFLPFADYQHLPPQTPTLQGPVHTELLVIALTMKEKKVEYPFLAMSAYTVDIAKSSV